MMLSLFALAAFASTSVAVKPIHSHNDYTRAVPLWTALNLSIMSVEADVWWQSSQLFVAHTSGEIDKTKTLNSLYLANILGIINGTISSPHTVRAPGSPGRTTAYLRMSRISVDNPLQLLIDFKSDGPTTFQPVHDALQSLRAAGHLTTFANGKLTQGAVTVVGTGNTPLASVVASNPRDIFFDADIRQLYSTKPGVGLEWGPEIAPLASVDYSSVSSTAQMQELVRNAHDFGIRSRFWDTASNVGTWNTFWAAGSDWVNADDLQAVSNAWGVFDSTVGAALAAFDSPQALLQETS
ncbi:Altered inheritance of mitochondria protein 6-like protein [Mycena venus]|uniref:Altered inheritance of mitochondria protein 6 n=1 Tax=Mycena venus TaxID=2733690 RepID=A0A8H6Y1K7_9AGAR|nr:Altered inheritance of mitochondria protein 6-like protein [Mycena venus]